MTQELTTLENDMLQWRNTLNQEGVWIFLSTLGCWSVPSGWIRLLALALAVIIFLWRAFAQQKDMKPFPPRLTALESKVRASVGNEIEQKAYLYDISILREKYASLRSMRHGFVYFLCFGFWIVSLYESLPPIE